MSLFHEVLYRPLFNALIALYAFVPGSDFGVAIILLTIIVRLLLTPLLLRQVRSQRALALLQPKATEIRKQAKDNTEQSRRLLALYQQHGVNPASGCLPLIVQLPVLWAVYAVLRDGLLPNSLQILYPFVPHPGTVDPVAFGVLHLGQAAFQRSAGGLQVSWPVVLLALCTGLVTYWQMRLTPTPHTAAADRTPAEQAAHRMSRQMLTFMPLFAVYFALVFPAGLALYWLVSTLVATLQQWFLLRKVPRVGGVD